MSDDLVTLQRRAGHRRGHSAPMRERAAEDRSLDAALSMTGVPVGSFTPDGGPLTAANFDGAFRAAVAWCYAQLSATTRTSFNVSVPAGNWTLLSPVLFPGTSATYGGDTPTPGVVGAGEEATNIICAFDNSDPTAGAFDCGSTTNLTIRQRFEGFTLRTDNDTRVGCGIVHRAAFRLIMRSVLVRGFGAVQHQIGGWGIRFAANDTNPHQHPYLDHVGSIFNQGGLYAHNIAQLDSDNLFITGNHWLDIVYENCSGALDGGTLQCDDVAGPTGLGWHYGTSHPAVTSGFRYTTGLASGASATLASATFANSIGQCVVTGLSGITSADVNRWLELTLAGEATSGTGRRISGVYQIIAVNSSSSVTILKGTNHSSTPSLAWQVRGHIGGSSLSIEGFPYHEGHKRCLVFHGPDDNTYSRLDVRNITNFNLTVSVIADRLADLRFTGAYPSNGATTVLQVRRCGTVTTDLDLSLIDTDEVTRPTITCRKSSTQLSSVVTSFPYAVDRPSARSVEDMLVEMGAAFVYAPRRKSSLTLSGSNITGATDIANGISITPTNAGIYPTRVNDSALGGNVMQILGNAAGASVGALQATIPTNKLPQRTFRGCLITIGRLTSVAASLGRVSAAATGQRAFVQSFNNSGAGYAALYAGDPTGSVIGYQTTLGADLEPWITYMQGAVSQFGSQDCDSGSEFTANLTIDGTSANVPLFDGTAAINMRIGHLAGQAVGSDFIGLVAFLPDPLSAEQLRLLKSAAAVEYRT